MNRAILPTYRKGEIDRKRRKVMKMNVVHFAVRNNLKIKGILETASAQIQDSLDQQQPTRRPSCDASLDAELVFRQGAEDRHHEKAAGHREKAKPIKPSQEPREREPRGKKVGPGGLGAEWKSVLQQGIQLRNAPAREEFNGDVAARGRDSEIVFLQRRF